LTAIATSLDRATEFAPFDPRSLRRGTDETRDPDESVARAATLAAPSCKGCCSPRRKAVPYYVILNFDIEDSSVFRHYERLVGPTLPSAVKVLIFDDERNDLEGQSHQRLVMLEFETQAAALQWYRSDAYQEAARHRQASTSGWVRGVAQFSRRPAGG
jgi:uncharacterized protein (DUF1330 family)